MYSPLSKSKKSDDLATTTSSWNIAYTVLLSAILAVVVGVGVLQIINLVRVYNIPSDCPHISNNTCNQSVNGTGAPCACSTVTTHFNTLSAKSDAILDKATCVNTSFTNLITTVCAVQFYNVMPATPQTSCPFMAGKKVLVTGATRGIGRATALRFVQLGATVYGTSRNLSTMVNPPTGVTMLQLEYADDASIDALVNYFVSNSITLDVLFGNGATGHVGFTRFFSEADLEYILRATYSGHAKLQRKLRPHMPTTGYARIIETVSSAAYFPGAIGAVYDAGKAALLSYMAVQNTHALAIGDNIRYSAILPGQVNTTLFYNSKFGTTPTVSDPEFQASVAMNATLMNLLTNAGASPEWVAEGVVQTACASDPKIENFVMYPPGFTTTIPGFENPNLSFVGLFNIRVRQGLDAFEGFVLNLLAQTIAVIFP